MSKGYQGKFHRQNLLSRFAKDLVRRARSRCELCDKSGVKLEVYEVSPLEEEPLVDHCIFICESCLKQITHPKKMVPSYWRCLNQSVWSEIPVIRVMAVRMLRRLSIQNQHWAEELLEHTYLEPELEEWSLLAD